MEATQLPRGELGGEEALFEPTGPTIRTPCGISELDERAPRMPWTWAAAVIAAIIYGSLIPFEIDWTVFQTANLFGLLRLTAHGTTTEDLLTNVLIYIPVGLTLALCATRFHLRTPMRFVFAVAAGAALSLFAETMQAGIAIRVASWVDVMTNTLGSAIGASLAVALNGHAATAAGHLRRAFVNRPATICASVLAVGLLLYGLMPFDFTTCTADLHTSFGRARWDLAGPRGIAFGRPPFELLIGQLSSAFWFAALGCLLVMAEWESRHHTTFAVRSAVLQGVVLVTVVEFSQLFTKSHVFDIAVIALRSLAVMLGAWFAVFTATVTRSTSVTQMVSFRTRHNGFSIPMVALAGLIAVQILARLLASVDPTLLTSSVVDMSRVHWLPFETLWHQPMPRAASEVVAHLITYGTMAIAVALLLTRIGFRSVWFLTGGAIASVAIAVEFLRFCTMFRAPDLSGPVLALAAVVLTSQLRWALLPIITAPPAASLARGTDAHTT